MQWSSRAVAEPNNDWDRYVAAQATEPLFPEPPPVLTLVCGCEIVDQDRSKGFTEMVIKPCDSCVKGLAAYERRLNRARTRGTTTGRYTEIDKADS